MAYTWENKHQGRYFIKEELGRYTRKQQGHSDAQKYLWKRRTTAEITVIRRNKTTEDLELLEEI